MNNDKKMAKILNEADVVNRKLKDAHNAKLKEESKAMLEMWGLWFCVGLVVGMPIGKFLL